MGYMARSRTVRERAGLAPFPLRSSLMETNEILHKLASFSKRLATLADQVHEMREQAQHTLDRIYLLREDIEQVRRRLAADMGEESRTPLPSR